MALPPIPTPATESVVVTRMREFQAALAARDAETVMAMGEQWVYLEQALEANISALALEIADMEVVSQAAIYKMNRYKSLLGQMHNEMGKYDAWAQKYIAEGQYQMGAMGVSNAADLVNLSIMQGGYATSGVFFDRLPVDAVNLIVGNVGPGGPVHTLLEDNYPMAVEQMTQALVRSVAMGLPPMQTAREMMNGMAGGLNHAMTVARSELLRVYREASRLQYDSTGAVIAYKRLASRSGNTCILCLMLDGEIYETDELMYVHPNDRCCMIPIVRGVDPPEWELGRDWLKRQDAALQKKIMGPGAWEMWKSGELNLMDLVDKTHHPTWGPSLRRVPLKDLRGGPGAGGAPVSPDVGDSGPAGWKPSMTRSAANEWAADSAIPGPVYHGTGVTEKGIVMAPDKLEQVIESITNEGFALQEKYTNGNMLGPGIYVTPEAGRAARYGTVLELRVNVQNPLILEQREWSRTYQRIIREMKKEGLQLSPQERIKWWVEKEGIDAIQITNALPQIVVFDPKNLVVVK